MYLTDNGKFSQQLRQIRTDHEQFLQSKKAVSL